MSRLSKFFLPTLLLLIAAAPAFPKQAKLSTADGLSLSATTGIIPNSATGIVFVHMLGGSKEEWLDMESSAFRQGISVVAMDLRGHGENISTPTPPPDDATCFAMTRDVQSAVTYLRSQGIKKVSLVGASLGANLAIRTAADDPNITSVTLLSPGLSYKGVTASDAVTRYGNRPLLEVVSKEDTYAWRSAATLDKLATGAHQLLLLDGMGHGTLMLSRDPTLSSTIIGFIRLSSQ